MKLNITMYIYTYMYTNIAVQVHPSRTACLYLLVRIELPMGEENKRNAKYIHLILFDDQVKNILLFVFRKSLIFMNT